MWLGLWCVTAAAGRSLGEGRGVPRLPFDLPSCPQNRQSSSLFLDGARVLVVVWAGETPCPGGQRVLLQQSLGGQGHSRGRWSASFLLGPFSFGRVHPGCQRARPLCPGLASEGCFLFPSPRMTTATMRISLGSPCERMK